MKIQGAGGTPGGVGSFFTGFLMMCVGFYLLLQSIVVTQSFGWGAGLFNVPVFGWSMPVTSGTILIPMMAGVGLIFFNGRSLAGWGLAIGSLGALIAGVIMNIHFSMRGMTLFDLLTILVLCMGGTGLFLRSLRDFGAGEREKDGRE